MAVQVFDQPAIVVVFGQESWGLVDEQVHLLFGKLERGGCCAKFGPNFFVGMDGVIKSEKAGVWLAETSLSFDISVLELLWTLTRGYKVVVYAGDDEVPYRMLED